VLILINSFASNNNINSLSVADKAVVVAVVAVKAVVAGDELTP